MKLLEIKYLICIVAVFTLVSCKLSLKQRNTKNEDKVSVLIVDGFSNHNWPQTTKLVKQVLERSGLFSVAVSTAPEIKDTVGWNKWNPQFTKYDVVVQSCNSIGNNRSWPVKMQIGLETYVENGGGLYILHSANNAFPEWEKYNKMIGLGWRKVDFGFAITIDSLGNVIRIPAGQGNRTSHGKRVDAILTRLGDHPIHENLPERWKAADLEIYRYARGPAENLTVLSYAKDSFTQINFPIEWVVKYGEGNVYNSTMGHVWRDDILPPSIRCIAFQTSIVRAIEWLGTGKVTLPIPENFPDEKTISLQPIEEKEI